MAPSKNSNKGGGVKGFFTRAAASFQQGFQISRDVGYWLAMKGGRIGLVLASTSMVVLMPLIFEINREITVRLSILWRVLKRISVDVLLRGLGMIHSFKFMLIL